MRFGFISRKLFGIAAALVTSTALAQSTIPEYGRHAQVAVSASNQGAALPDGGLYFIHEDQSGLITDGSPLDFSSQLSYSGVDRQGNDATMTFNGTGFVQGDYGIIKTRYNGTLFNSFYNEDNPFLYNSLNQEYDSSGVPDVMNGVASAGWIDRVLYGGTATGYFASYVLRITGSNENYKSFSLLDINVGGTGNQRFAFYDSGDVDQIFRTTPVFIGQDGLRTTVDMISIFQPNMRELEDGATFSGDSNFANTVQLVGIELKDEFGNLVTDVDLYGLSGTQYQAVPEPGALLLLSGLGALFGFSRKGKRKRI